MILQQGKLIFVIVGRTQERRCKADPRGGGCQVSRVNAGLSSAIMHDNQGNFVVVCFFICGGVQSIR